jgi:cellulose synthase/poly-beta-1,6-N-acetylglucosamine synthase-like glycosyltransferase
MPPERGRGRLRLGAEIAAFALGTIAALGAGLLGASALLQVGGGAVAHGWRSAGAVLLALVALLMGLRWAVVLVLALRGHARRTLRPPPDPGRWPRVSILLPAHDEAATIEDALRAFLALDYPDFEVVCVDDGSTDRTSALARPFAGWHGAVHVQVMHQPNGGKWSALNRAWQHSDGELVLCVDADSLLRPDALRWLVRTLLATGAAGVAGQVRVRNRDRWLTRLQALEYLTCQSALRAAQHASRTVLVVPGPIGLYRRSVLAALPSARRADATGPFEGDTFAEDFDLSLAVLARGGAIVYEPRAVAQTKAPAALPALLNQRYRWMRGSIQVLRKFGRDAARDPRLLRPDVLAWLIVTYGCDLVLLPVTMLLAVALIATSTQGWTIGAASTLAAALGAGVVANLGFASTQGDRLRLALLEPFAWVYSSLVLPTIYPFVLLDEVRRAPMRW